MMNTLQLKEAKVLDVQFVGDDDVLNHIFDREGGTKLKKEKAQLLVNPQKIIKKPERELEKSDQEVLKDQNYVEVLGRNIQESLKNGSSVDGGNKVYSFQQRKHSEEMAKLALELAKKPRKVVPLDSKNVSEITKNTQKSKVPTSHDDSESGYSASDSEREEEEDTSELGLPRKSRVQSGGPAAPVSRGTPAKKMKRDKASDLVEEYFEAHSSSKVLTSDRTLQKLRRAKLDQKTLRNLLSKFSPSFSAEIAQLNQQHEKLFQKWMLQLHLGFNIVLYGLGSKRDLLEKFRTTMLQDSIHVVINGFFPGISVKSILNSITEEVLNHMGTFQSVLDQRDWIINKFKEDSSLELFLLIHNLDSQMLRGDTSQQVLGQLSSLENVYLLASIDHLNAPLMWDHAKQSLYNWLWYETTTYNPYSEETSYENSLLVKQSGSLPLSSLIHVLRSLTPNARGIFRLLIKFQLDNQDSPSYIGLSFQDFYQQCREAFLVNSDLTLRAQLTEFRDHKLIRTKKGTDGVEYLLIPVDSGTLADFLEKEEEEA
ncbi:origin recognition complex subunit 2 isoform X2 [Onychomys torridus]|uniref:origin recognition complex subunit 2 isoform X2 n=1 Tax=Onychomys torridus TaxID=38674 RepID=UPI00167F28D7|nr:origin recognition complex subunit 2 isoform X2 [Onychomys torridus]